MNKLDFCKLGRQNERLGLILGAVDLEASATALSSWKIRSIDIGQPNRLDFDSDGFPSSTLLRTTQIHDQIDQVGPRTRNWSLVKLPLLFYHCIIMM